MMKQLSLIAGLAAMLLSCSSPSDPSPDVDTSAADLVEVLAPEDLTQGRDTNRGCSNWQESHPGYTEKELALAENYCQYLFSCKHLSPLLWDSDCCSDWFFTTMEAPGGLLRSERVQTATCAVNSFSSFYGTDKVCKVPEENCGSPILP